MRNVYDTKIVFGGGGCVWRDERFRAVALKDIKSANFYRESDFVEWSFKLAERYFPANKLIINEWSNLWSDTLRHRSRGRYYMQIERAMLKGARIDSVGIRIIAAYGKARTGYLIYDIMSWKWFDKNHGRIL